MTNQPNTKEQLIADMKACEQTKNLHVLDHGILVRDRYNDLISIIKGDKEIDENWSIPDWAFEPGLIERLLPDDIIEEYQVYHDCGKPYCLAVDQDGKRHFPDHARCSENIWLSLNGAPQVATLMRMDMDAHLLKADQVEEFSRRPEAITLLFTALAEVHANASMFGGIQSTSFKIKAKHLKRRGRQVINAIRERG